MATYPGGIPSLPTYGPTDYPQATQFNTPNAEIVAICTELGIDPHVIDDTVAPGASPASVAAYLDMLANTVKTMTGASAWHKAAVPNRFYIGGNCLGQTVGGTSIDYPIIYGHGFGGNENLSTYIVTFQNYNIVWDAFYIEFITQQAITGGTLGVTLRVNGLDWKFFSIPGAWPAGYHRFGGEGESAGFDLNFEDTIMPVTVNQIISIEFQNTGTTQSAQIGAWSLEGRQAG